MYIYWSGNVTKAWKVVKSLIICFLSAPCSLAHSFALTFFIQSCFSCLRNTYFPLSWRGESAMCKDLIHSHSSKFCVRSRLKTNQNWENYKVCNKSFETIFRLVISHIAVQYWKPRIRQGQRNSRRKEERKKNPPKDA